MAEPPQHDLSQLLADAIERASAMLRGEFNPPAKNYHQSTPKTEFLANTQPPQPTKPDGKETNDFGPTHAITRIPKFEKELDRLIDVIIRVVDGVEIPVLQMSKRSLAKQASMKDDDPVIVYQEIDGAQTPIRTTRRVLNEMRRARGEADIDLPAFSVPRRQRASRGEGAESDSFDDWLNFLQRRMSPRKESTDDYLKGKLTSDNFLTRTLMGGESAAGMSMRGASVTLLSADLASMLVKEQMNRIKQFGKDLDNWMIGGGRQSSTSTSSSGEIAGGMKMLGSAARMSGADLQFGQPTMAGMAYSFILLGETITQVSDKIKQWGEMLHQSNMKFAEFSGAMSRVQGWKEVQDIYLSKAKGDARAPLALEVAKADTELEKAQQPTANLLNFWSSSQYLGWATAQTIFWKGVNEVLDALGLIAKNTATLDENNPEIFNQKSVVETFINENWDENFEKPQRFPKK